MSSPSFHEEYLRTWQALLERETIFYQDRNINGKEWLFRGMHCSGWPLKTSLERTCETQGNNDLCKAANTEYLLYREFRRRYQNYRAGTPNPVGIEWLSLMQHYGAPTRLLDFTYSFFIAVYFAMEKSCEESCPHAIWAVRSKWVKERGIQLLREGGKDVRYLENVQNEQEWELQQPFFESLLNLLSEDEEPIGHSQEDPLCVFPVNAMRLNERSTIQQGVFLCPGKVTKPFEENLKSLEGFDNEENLVKLIIPDHLRLEALARLHAMNINRASLFPGLQGFAESLGIYHPSLRKNSDNL